MTGSVRRYFCKCGHRQRVIHNWPDGDDYWRNLYCAKCDENTYTCERPAQLTDSSRLARARKNEKFRSKSGETWHKRKMANIAREEAEATGVHVDVIRERLGLPPIKVNMRRK